jgi:hypothetical protein
MIVERILREAAIDKDDLVEVINPPSTTLSGSAAPRRRTMPYAGGLCCIG